MFIAHGYNINEQEVIDRHRRLSEDLNGMGFKGVVVSYDWPCGNQALAYLADRHKAKLTSFQLVNDGIRYLSEVQTPDCPINIHLLGHSVGAYVIREAFDDADDSQLPNGSWNVSQIMFAAGDVSSASMSEGDSGTASLYRHCLRLTNYSNKFDEALGISNVKRMGVAPRAGRIGLPDDAPGIAVNVDCSDYYNQLVSDATILAPDQPSPIMGMKSHSWYFGNLVFTRDLMNTMIGVDRSAFDTRVGTGSRFKLTRPK
ncbi:alpha/beta hydrolase [Undibacterium arcticum]|uniref:alpha/beta hydrolase n=1 Tax=Undibacterium arcticum TaxID=1762892 RepID=UPI00361448F6